MPWLVDLMSGISMYAGWKIFAHGWLEGRKPPASGLRALPLLLVEVLRGMTIACGLPCGGGGLVELTLLFLRDLVVLAGPTPPPPAAAAAVVGPTLPLDGGRDRDLERDCC